MKKKDRNKGVLFPPLVGYSFPSLIRVLRVHHISPQYYLKVLFILLINLINLPFRLYEQVFINPRFRGNPIKNAPIFIIGHWRSGTTHLHNLLSQDAQMGYVTTYQSVFPDTLFNKLGRLLFRGFMKLLIPKKREGDNVVLNPKLPQEEEFTIGHRVPLSFYLFWFFPKKSAIIFKRCIKLNGIHKENKNKWIEEYKLIISKALKNTNGDIFLSKNPPNTARIDVLLEMFPNAKFIHIHRNPFDVYLSTQNFFRKMMPHLQLENINKEEINELVIEGYNRLMQDYIKNKDLIPKDNLYELSFDDLESSSMNCLKEIYTKLQINGFDEASIRFGKYIDAMKSYKKNKLSIDQKELDLVSEQWAFMTSAYNYSVPAHIEILNNA
ncbi:MAG: hypothetical protein BM563_07645 [Bacteroidetes bacterium MedPE-SWsnd-G1]|nr:MAG: hypothetical protein BM563_07645 [Bacteroidetes bacterium MedPE-SWsnd-G1]